jgi:hypothetical protein
MDLMGGALAVALGAAVGVCLDEIYAFTPRLGCALARLFGR